MWEYLAVLLIGFWLGVAIFLYISCYWLEEILDLPPKRNVPGPNPSSVGASGAHVQLKRLVARVVEEASGMPSLTRYPAEPHTPSLESSTYEDLLATAILNKVIERYQNENGSGGRSSGIHSASASPTPSERSSPRSLNSRHNRDITPPMHEEDDVSDWEEGTDEAVELPRRVPFPEFGRDIVHDIDNEEREFDEVSSSDLQAVDGSWEENWLFQKKKIKTQSVPVPMLVPNSNTEYRALIGDRDADDTTDLSDNASDSEEQIADYKSDMKRVIDSKHVIGGKPKAYESDFEPDSLTSIDAGDEFDQLVDKIEDDRTVNAFIDEINDNKLNIVETINHNASDQVDGGKLVLSIDSGPLSKAEFAMKEEIHRSLFNGNADGLTDSFHAKTNGVLHNSVSDLLHGEDSFISNKESMSTHSRHEREGEYEETVARPVQRHADSLRRKHFEDGPEFRTQFTDQNHELIPGSIAYRERKKWLNYVEMPNNPYSPEAIQKRLSTKNSATLFDMFTKKESEDGIEISDHDERQIIEEPKKNINRNKLTLAHSNDSINNIDRSTKSASPRVLKDIVAEDIPQYRRFGRDYYVREAKSSSGGRKKTSMSETSSVSSMNKSASLDNFDTEFMSPGLLIKQFNQIATKQQYTTFAGKEDITSLTTTVNNKDDIMIEYDDTNETNLFTATAVVIDDDTDRKFQEILETAYKTAPTEPPPPIPVDNDEKDEPLKSPISVDSTSSMEDSIKIYNVQTGEIIKCKPEDNISTRYETDTNDNTDIVDKNILEVDSVSSSNDVHEQTVLKDTVEKKLDLEVDDILQNLPKVKELAKKFVSMDNLEEPVKVPQPHIRRRKSKDNILTEPTFKPEKAKQMYMHSLTARSISKEFRDELKLSKSTPFKVPGGSNEIPEGTEDVTKESSRPGSPLPEPGTIKTKLAFFESLKSKFSSK